MELWSVVSCSSSEKRIPSCWTSWWFCKYTKVTVYFFINFWRTSVLFVGSLIPSSLTSGDFCPGFQSQRWSLHLLHASSPTCKGILGFTSGATPPDILAASMVVEPFRPCTSQFINVLQITYQPRDTLLFSRGGDFRMHQPDQHYIFLPYRQWKCDGKTSVGVSHLKHFDLSSHFFNLKATKMCQ